MTDLYAYMLSAHKFRDTKSQRRLDHLKGDGNGGDVLDTFDRVIAKGVEHPPPPPAGEADERKVISTVEKVLIPSADKRVRYGHINVSRPTVAQDVDRARHGDRVEIDTDDRGHRRLFFWFVAPKQGHNGLLLTERSGGYGIATSFWREHLLGELRNDFPINNTDEDVSFNLDPFVPEEPWQKYEAEGRGLEGADLTKVLYEERETSEADQGSVRRRVGKLTIKLDYSIVPTKERVVDVFKRKDPVAAIELAGGEYLTGIEEFDTVTIHANFDGKVRPVRIQKGKMTQLGYPVDLDVVKFDRRGYPVLDDMATFAGELANSVAGKLLGI